MNARQTILLCVSVVVLIAAAVIYFTSRPADARGPSHTTDWVCLDEQCAAEFSMSVAELAAVDRAGGDVHAVDCPKCGKNNTRRAAKCPQCEKLIPFPQDYGVIKQCPHCQKKF